MRRLPFVPVSLTLVITLGMLLAGCADAEHGSLERADLEERVAAHYPPRGDREVTVRCDGGLGGEVGAIQNCVVRVGKDRAVARSTVTEAGEDGPRFETVPVVPAEQVARKVLAALIAEEYVVSEVVCAGELVGVPGESVACTAKPAPPATGGPVELRARVGAVRGLDVAIRYRITG